jgi:hypothetical protein
MTPQIVAGPVRRGRLRFYVLYVSAVVVLGLAAGYIGAVVAGVAPNPLADSGVTACEQVRDVQQHQGVSLDDARGWRSDFAGSRHTDLRDAGTKFMDLTAEYVAYSPDQRDAAALTLASPIMQSYGSLVGACGAHGVTLPPTLAGS